MRASSKNYAEFRKLQLEIIQRNKGDGEEDSDVEELSAEEVSGDELPESPAEERRPLKQVLQLVKPVETRWNSTFFMLQR
jgi:hypothetical protein